MPRSNEPIAINLNDYTQTSRSLGSNPGGFFRNNKNNKEYYIKWLPAKVDQKVTSAITPEERARGKTYKDRNRNRFNNEYLALKIYSLYGIAVPKAEFITFKDNNGAVYYGIMSEKQNDIVPLNHAHMDEAKFSAIRTKASEDFLIDVLISNYDVVGLELDNMHFDPKTLNPFRLDPGGALRYKAQGAPKKNAFNDQVNEFEEMESGDNKKTKFYGPTLKSASYVFNGVFDSPGLVVGLRKIFSVSDQQIRDCVVQYGFDTGVDGNKGRKKNEAIIAQLLARKQTLIMKAEEKIFNKLTQDFPEMTNHTTEIKTALAATKPTDLKEQFLIKVMIMFHNMKNGADTCRQWLTKAGFDEKDIKMVHDAIKLQDKSSKQNNTVYNRALATIVKVDDPANVAMRRDGLWKKADTQSNTPETKKNHSSQNRRKTI